MYNGTYLVNGEVRVIDIHTLKTKTRTVKMYPLISVYENSAVFEIDGADSGNGCYNIYKSDGIYKVQKYTISVIHDNYKSYIKPTDELIDYAETVARILGINLNH